MEFENQQHHQALAEMWRQYREATPEVEPSVNFMPGLWNKIEAKRARRQVWHLAAQRLLAAAVACCLIAAGISLGEAVLHPQPEAAQYVDDLESEDETMTMAVLYERGEQNAAEVQTNLPTASNENLNRGNRSGSDVGAPVATRKPMGAAQDGVR